MHTDTEPTGLAPAANEDLVQTLNRLAASAAESAASTAPELPSQRIAHQARASAFTRAAQIAGDMLYPAPGRPPARRRILCHDLTEDDREAVEGWLRRHDIDLASTPADVMVEYFPDTDEWGIEQFILTDDGDLPGPPSDPDGPRTTVRRPNRGPLPAPRPHR